MTERLFSVVSYPFVHPWMAIVAALALVAGSVYLAIDASR